MCKVPPHCSFSAPPPMSPISENSTASSVPSSDATLSKSHHPQPPLLPPPLGISRNGNGGHHQPLHHQQQQQRSQQMISSPDEAGFNSNCQQCLAERAAVEGSVIPTRPQSCNYETSAASETTLGPSHHQSSTQLDTGCVVVDETLEAFQERRCSSAASNNSNGRFKQQQQNRPGRTYECEVVFRDSLRLFAGCLGICFLAAGYAAIGGFLFMAIESRGAKVESAAVMSLMASAANNSSLPAVGSMPESVRQDIDKARLETVTRLWQVTEKMNILYPENWTRQAAEEIVWFQDQMAKALLTAKNRESSPALAVETTPAFDSQERRREWSFAHGLLYSVSLLTTVGKLKSQKSLLSWMFCSIWPDDFDFCAAWRGETGGFRFGSVYEAV